MRVLLVRHAKAFERDAAAWPDDTRRPLTVAGRTEFVRLAKRLRSALPAVDLLLSSPAVRAWQTARLLHEYAGWPEPSRCDALSLEQSAAVVRPDAAIPASAWTGPQALVALVGHEPVLSQTASWLLTADAARLSIDMKKGAVVAIDLPESARSAPAGSGTLLWMAIPRLARGKRKG